MSRDRLHRVGGKWVELPEQAGAAPEAVPAYTGSSTRAELAELAARWGLSTSGTKAQLAKRLKAESARRSAAVSDEPVEPVDGGAQVDAVSLGDERGAQVEELATGEPGSDLLDENADVFGHEDEG